MKYDSVILIPTLELDGLFTVQPVSQSKQIYIAP